MNENVIEWLEGDKFITCTFSQKKFINKCLRLAEQQANNVTILALNNDGSILVRLPIEMLKLSPKRRDNISEERKEILREQLRNARNRNKEE